MLIELKSGDTYNGRLINCDSWMNINLIDVICTSKEGTKFWKMSECYIRGSSIKFLRLPEDMVNMVPNDDILKHRGYGKGNIGKTIVKSNERNQRDLSQRKSGRGNKTPRCRLRNCERVCDKNKDVLDFQK